MSNSLWPHGLQHARSPWPSPTPRVYSNSCPLSRWCHPTISSSVIPFSSHLQSFLASGSFPMNQFFQWTLRTDLLQDGLVGLRFVSISFISALIFTVDFPGGSVVKKSSCQCRTCGLISGLGRSPGEGNDNPLQCSCLGNPMDREALQATVHGVVKELDTT